MMAEQGYRGVKQRVAAMLGVQAALQRGDHDRRHFDGSAHHPTRMSASRAFAPKPICAPEERLVRSGQFVIDF
jgi:hypothetical protein